MTSTDSLSRPHGVRSALAPFGTTVFARITAAANKHGAVNLGQGFPDDNGPEWLRAAAAKAVMEGPNQYARSMGSPDLVKAISRNLLQRDGIYRDPMTEVAVTCGATESMAAAMLGLFEPDDEIVLFAPFYDAYLAVAAMAGVRVRIVNMLPPAYGIDAAALDAVITPATRAIVLNTPHNPTGRVLTPQELDIVAQRCILHDLIAISDEVYEHLTFDGRKHVPLCTRHGMANRTLTVTSTGKTFSLTGWKIGYAHGPKHLVDALQAAHQFLTFCAPAPLQHAMLAAMDAPASYFDTLRASYQQRRDKLATGLEQHGFRLHGRAEGGYFQLVDLAGSAFSTTDAEDFADAYIAEGGVAGIPVTAFCFKPPAAMKGLLRFAFCKADATIDAALQRLATKPPARGKKSSE